jgi:hypothetical protein
MVVDRGYEDFLELRQREVRRIHLPRTPVNKSLAAGVIGTPSLTQESDNRSIRRSCYVVLGANGY